MYSVVFDYPTLSDVLYPFIQFRSGELMVFHKLVKHFIHVESCKAHGEDEIYNPMAMAFWVKFVIEG